MGHVTNLSQNIVLINNANANMLCKNEATTIGAGDTLSFAVQVEFIRGDGAEAAAAAVAAASVVASAAEEEGSAGSSEQERVSIAPFLSFRLVTTVPELPVTSPSPSSDSS